jgi:Fur family transcriptional regulator, peroxide stress response regulator
MANNTVVKLLVEHRLKVTPQRLAILEVLLSLDDHPTAESIIRHIRLSHPNIAAGTVYKTLDTFLKKGLISKVITEMDIVRYDAVPEEHHHLYCPDTERIEDYFDTTLYEIINEYLKKKKIPNFIIKDIKLQIVGKFLKNKK